MHSSDRPEHTASPPERLGNLTGPERPVRRHDRTIAIALLPGQGADGVDRLGDCSGLVVDHVGLEELVALLQDGPIEAHVDERRDERGIGMAAIHGRRTLSGGSRK